MSLFFNMLSRLVIAFLPRSKCLLISWLQSPSAVILELKKIKSLTISIVSPSICHEVIGPDPMIFVFWILHFKPAFSVSSFTVIKRLFSFSSFSAIRVVSLPLGGHGNPLQYSCLENPHRHRSVAGYSPWHCKELDATQQLSTAQQSKVILYSIGVGRVKLIFITTINGV